MAYRNLLLEPEENGAAGDSTARAYSRPRQLYHTLRSMRAKIRQLDLNRWEPEEFEAGAELRP